MVEMEAVLTHKIAESYRKERSNLLEFIRSKVRCYEDAEDILQDVFYQAVVNMNVFEPIDNMIGWLYKVAKNRIIDWYRAGKSQLNYQIATIRALTN